MSSREECVDLVILGKLDALRAPPPPVSDLRGRGRGPECTLLLRLIDQPAMTGSVSRA